MINKRYKIKIDKINREISHTESMIKRIRANIEKYFPRGIGYSLYSLKGIFSADFEIFKMSLKIMFLNFNKFYYIIRLKMNRKNG
jgi:hypothetical protein